MTPVQVHDPLELVGAQHTVLALPHFVRKGDNNFLLMKEVLQITHQASGRIVAEIVIGPDDFRHDGCVFFIVVKEGTGCQKKQDGVNGVGVKWDFAAGIMILLGFVGGPEEGLEPVKKTTQLVDDLLLEKDKLLVGVKKELLIHR